MPLPDNRIVVSIGGKTHADWKTYDIDSDLLTPADAFNLTLGATEDLPPRQSGSDNRGQTTVSRFLCVVNR